MDIPFLNNRANQTVQWVNTDKEQNYKTITKKGPNLYSKTDVEYKYNSDGYRCDDFTLPSDFPIVFVGCSSTEGIGLPLYETWSYKILEKIRAKTGFNIPYWSVALGGVGIDTAPNKLYWLTSKYKIKPKIVFGLFPPLYRREFQIMSDTTGTWLPNMQMNDQMPINVERLFSDEFFTLHQSARSLTTLEVLCELHESQMWCGSWGLENAKQRELLNSFPSITHFDNVNPRLVDMARDDVHAGPVTQTRYANDFWCALQESDLFHRLFRPLL